LSLVSYQDEEAVKLLLEDPATALAGLSPPLLAASCLRLMLRLQWALHCRAQVRPPPASKDTPHACACAPGV
jgi:hypothetical protein